MRKVWAIIRRELIAYFSSPLAYVVMTGFLVIQGFIFERIVSILNNPQVPIMTPLRAFFGGTVFFWLILLFIVPMITMRLIAEERGSGTIEVLMTSPVSEVQVVVGKFTAAMAFYAALWLPTTLYVLILMRNSEIDIGPVFASYLGVILLGFFFLAIGTFVSTLTKNQIIAATISFAAMLLLFSVELVEQTMISSSVFRSALSHMNLWTQMDDFAKGIVDTRHVIYQLSGGVFFLFLAVKSLEVKKWR
jgi:ABC-2 type transport system permease protein